MKMQYLKPEQEILELMESAVLCSSPTDGVGGSFGDLITDDDSDFFTN